MLFKILKLFGLDVPAKIAVARLEFEQRVEETAVYAKQATLTAALVAALSAVAALLFIVATGVGLFALYRVVDEHYGVYAGLGSVAGLLIVAASALLLAANTKAQALSNLRIVRQSPSPAISPAPVNLAPQDPAILAAPAAGDFSAEPNESASDLFEPLAFAFAKYIRFPAFENPVLDQFVGSLKASAEGTADDAVRRAANLIRHGNRTQLLAIIGGAAALGWLLARQNSAATLRDITPSG
jgi:hypothetical protein